MMVVLFSVAICVFFTIVALVEYYTAGAGAWFAPLIALIPSVYGMVVFVKKYWPKSQYEE